MLLPAPPGLVAGEKGARFPAHTPEALLSRHRSQQFTKGAKSTKQERFLSFVTFVFFVVRFSSGVVVDVSFSLAVRSRLLIGAFSNVQFAP